MLPCTRGLRTQGYLPAEGTTSLFRQHRVFLSYIADMSEHLIRNRMLCLDQAAGFLAAAERVGPHQFPHIAYHLGLLALEEVGKASMIAGHLATGEDMENWGMGKALESHRRKLQWAIWSPIARIDPKDFEAAREFAERAHAMRLASLYVDARAELADLPPGNIVSAADAEQVLALAGARLDYERANGTPDPNARVTDEQLRWFLDTMADADHSRQLLSKPFVDKYHDLGNDARAWVAWARAEFARRDEEANALLREELAKPAAPMDRAKPKWRTNTTIFTPSHSIRPKALKRWNAQIEAAQLLWSGKKDRFTLQLTLPDNAPLSALAPRATHLTQLAVACLNIGSIGYFWFERPGFERQMFDEVRDLEHNRRIEIQQKEGFWGHQRSVALTDEHIDHAIRCMMAFAPLTEEEAAPIFRPYFDGLALIAKSDIFYNFDRAARRNFVASLKGALAKYAEWDGKDESFRASFDEAFAPIIREKENRDQMLLVLTPEGDPSESSLGNLRCAKQLVDLYLILAGRRTWRRILEWRG